MSAAAGMKPGSPIFDIQNTRRHGWRAVKSRKTQKVYQSFLSLIRKNWL
jgi:hypothetical protein